MYRFQIGIDDDDRAVSSYETLATIYSGRKSIFSIIGKQLVRTSSF